ncbi:unnamed protein product [Trifolium pratense]|uniref:Uncharacterized protein n=1 Tax=Trifolium pratense TaxID=57577 RepID=A0ACB0K8D7_TRIPR|nr:unnamed protein product [Trifolium pratense]
MFGPIRKHELNILVKSLEKVALVGEVVNVSEVIKNLIEDIVYKMILGRSKYEQFDLKKLIQERFALLGAFNLADYVPWLGVFDLQGLTRACKKVGKSLDDVLEVIITEHEQATNVQKNRHEDFVDILLSMMHQSIDHQNEENLVIDHQSIDHENEDHQELNTCMQHQGIVWLTPSKNRSKNNTMMFSRSLLAVKMISIVGLLMMFVV